MNKKWILLDCNYLCHRAKHATGGLSFQNQPTGVIFGVLQSLSSFQDTLGSSNFVFCWDSKISKRKEVYPEYKANRNNTEYTPEETELNTAFRRQMKLLRRTYLPMIGFRNIFMQKGYEADDIIASLTQTIPTTSEVVIISSDHDLFQCIKSNVSVCNPSTGKILTLQGFKKLYEINPDQWASVKAIAGCSTDNVKGVPGVGEKTAIKYLKGELKETTKAYINITNTKTVCQGFTNLLLVCLPFTGVNKFHLRPDQLSEAGWIQVMNKLGMKSLRKRMPFGERR